jgi:hypothetical protein
MDKNSYHKGKKLDKKGEKLKQRVGEKEKNLCIPGENQLS